MKFFPILPALFAAASLVVKPLWLKSTCIVVCISLCVLMIFGFFG